MFTTYIKSLNDLVFSTSETPEEPLQPSPGVLGRIGSWFSPWKGKTTKSVSENASSSSDCSQRTEEEESEGSVRTEEGELNWHEADSCSLSSYKEFFPCVEENATQSGHRDGSAVSGTETGVGGPKQEEGQGYASSETQGVERDSDQTHTQPAQTAPKLQVYLEETSVIHSHPTPQVVCTKKTLQVSPKANPRTNSDSPDSTEAQSSHNAVESPQPHKDSESENMGRRNASRRKVRKNSQGNGGKAGAGGQQDKGQDSHTGSSPLLSPEGGQTEISYSEQLEPLQNSASDTRTHEADADMEDDDSFYKVERKTETPESKRRSIKCSHSEVKIFPKFVALNSNKKEEEDQQDGAKLEPKHQTDTRFPSLTKIDEEPKSGVGRIADRINLFERNQREAKSVQTSRSTDVSPSRTVAGKFKADLFLSEQRSRSAERYGSIRSSSASPARDKPLSIKELAMKFAQSSESEAKAAPIQPPAKTGIFQKSIASAAVSSSESQERVGQGKQDADEHRRTKTNSGTTEEPAEPDDSAAAGVQIGDQAMKAEEPKGSNKTSSRSKRRKSKEAEPVSPTGHKKPAEEPATETKPESSVRHTVNSQRGSSELPVNKDEPDTAARSAETKKHIDRESSILTPKLLVKSEPESKNTSSVNRPEGKSTVEPSEVTENEGKTKTQTTEPQKTETVKRLETSGDKVKPNEEKNDENTQQPLLEKVSDQNVEHRRTPTESSENSVEPSAPPARRSDPKVDSDDRKAALCSVIQNDEPATERPGTQREEAITSKAHSASVSVEKAEISLDDSCAHGANDGEFSNTEHITKATPVSNGSHSAAASMVKKDLSAVEPRCKSKLSGAEPDGGVESSTAPPPALSEGQISGGQLTERLGDRKSDEVRRGGKTNDVTSLKGREKIIQSPSDCVNAHALPVANGDLSFQSNATLRKEPVNQIPKELNHPEEKKFPSQTNPPSSLKKLQFPPVSSKQRDSPSSWLDVDLPKRKRKFQETKLTSSASESDLLDSPDSKADVDFVEKIKKLCAPFSLPPRKHNHLRSHQPPFAMPAIREDRFEKTFDPEEFISGLSKKSQNASSALPNFITKLQSTETKSGQLPSRASFAERSVLFSSLDSHSRLRDKDERDKKEEKDEHIKVKSRLESSCVLSSLTSNLRVRRKETQMQGEENNFKDLSPGEAPHVIPPTQPDSASPASKPGIRDVLSKQSREEIPTAESVVSDSGPPLPSFNDIKLPDYLEKYLPLDQATSVQSTRGQDPVKPESNGKMSDLASGGKPEVTKAALVLPATTQPTLPEYKQTLTRPQGIVANNVKSVKGFHKRPGKMVLFEKAQFGGQEYEIYRDVADASSLKLSAFISVKIVRGCWVLYEKPDFQGRMIALEEGASDLENMWAELAPETEPENIPPMQIGSIRLAVRDYSVPRIDLYTEPEGRGRVTAYHDDTVETGSFGIPLNTASIQVHSGIWLLFSDPGFQGMISVLEPGEYPFPETWGFPSPFVGSLRPLKMGSLKVENPDEVKAVVYEQPGFQGSSAELDSDVFSFQETERGFGANRGTSETKIPKSVGSLKITGGFWVGYSQPGFEGQQHILEEGEYYDCSDWGGPELLSLRPIVSDFLSPFMKMFSDRDFGKLGVNIDVSLPVANMADTGYGVRTQSIEVMSGVWVVFEEADFCGESYVLEKGLYGSPEDWGALQHRVSSSMPVVLGDFEGAAKFKVQLFSEPDFQGSFLLLEDDAAAMQDGFSVASCKVLAGSWLAFEGPNFTGKMFVLELGNYADLRAMGCSSRTSSIQSLQTTGFEFSLPSITLFERSDLRGKRVLLTDGSVNLQLAGGCGRVQSVLVEGGIWVLYEGINYRGAQVLLKPGEVPDWRRFSHWSKIGSLRPLVQKQVHFRLRNRQTGLLMTVTGDLDDIKLLRIQETEETDGFEQIWFYQNGRLHCKLLEECCLNPSGSVVMAGSRVGFTPQLDNRTHLWSITPQGFVCCTDTDNLVLEIKGGNHYDKNQVILNTLDPNKPQQRWDVEII